MGDNVVLHYLRRIDAQLDGVSLDIAEMKQSLGGIVQILAMHDATTATQRGPGWTGLKKRFGIIDPAIPGE